MLLTRLLNLWPPFDTTAFAEPPPGDFGVELSLNSRRTDYRLQPQKPLHYSLNQRHTHYEVTEE
jgi:hypothetical protein